MTELEFDRPETPAEVALREWARQAGGVSYARVHGAVHGVIASSLRSEEMNRSPLRLLRLEAPPEVHDLAVRAVREVHALVPDAEGTVDEDAAALYTVPRLTDQAAFLEWLAGLGAVALAEPDVFMGAFSLRQQLEADRKLRRTHHEETEALLDMTRELLFLMTMTPPEFYPEGLAPEAHEVFRQTREQYATDPLWDEEGRRGAVLDVLAAVHQGYVTQHWLRESQVRELLDGEEWDAGTVRREGRKIRPNEPCPCGSGKKYKKCHGNPSASQLGKSAPAGHLP